jgi:predicted nuclease of predicted toxin-antitoxin system
VIQYHLDQHVDSAVARGLRLRGINVTTTAEAGLQDAPDEDHIAYAFSSSRVIFTQDDDYPRMHSQGVKHGGIVYAKQGTRSVGQIIQFLELMSQCLEQEDMVGQVEYL